MKGGELKSAVVLLLGNESYLKDKAINGLRASLLGGSSGDLDYRIFYAGEDNLREILDHATTFPFLSSRKLVVVKDVQNLSEEETPRLLSYIKNPSKFTCLVLESSDKTVMNKLGEVRSHVNVIECGILTDSEAYGWIRRFVNSKDKLIDEEAIVLLAELYRNDLLSLANELDKIISFKAEDKNITVQDVTDLCTGNSIGNVFEVAWAIGRKDAAKAIKIISELSIRGKKPYEIIGLLYWHLKRLLKAKELKIKGEDEHSIAGALGLYKKYQEDFFQQVDLYDADGLRSKIRLLLETDMDIKLTRFAPNLVMEFAVMRLCLT